MDKKAEILKGADELHVPVAKRRPFHQQIADDCPDHLAVPLGGEGPLHALGGQQDVRRRVGRAASLERLSSHQREPGDERRGERPVAVHRIAQHHRDDAILVQVFEVVSERLDGVEVALRQDIGAGRLRGEGVDRRDLAAR